MKAPKILIVLAGIASAGILWFGLQQTGARSHTTTVPATLEPSGVAPTTAIVAIPKVKIIRSIPPRPQSNYLARLVDRSLQSKDRFSSDLNDRYKGANEITKDDIPAMVYCLMDETDQDGPRNEVAVLLRRAKISGISEALVSVIENPDEKPRFRAFAAQHLGSMLAQDELKSEERVKSKLKELLSDKDIAVRREALFALVRKKDTVGIEIAVQWLHAKGSEADATRDLTIRCVHELDLREEIPVIREHALDENEITRIAALVVLGLWGDEASRDAMRQSANSKSMRVHRAAEAALGNLNSLDRLLPKSRQTAVNLTELLKSRELGVRIGAAKGLRALGSDAKISVPRVAEKLLGVTSSTDIDEFCAYLDLIRTLGKDAKECAGQLTKLLSERSAIYEGRAKPTVYKLRAYILLTIADVGEASAALESITDMLATSDKDMVFNFAAAAYAAGSLGENGANLTQLLLRAVRSDFIDVALTFESFDSKVNFKNRTSARLETIRALGKIGSGALIAMPALIEIAKREPSSRMLPAWSSDAKAALNKIQGTNSTIR